MSYLAELSNLYQTFLTENPFTGNPVTLYEPMQYMMSLGGKRVRPLLVLCGARCAGGNADTLLPVAHAMEVFHNFTLVHDDIMDNATVRRGMPVVHKRWDPATAILAGDNMLIAAVESLSNYNGPGSSAIMQRFLHTAREICEGQQLDMDFSRSQDVTEAEYLNMIRLKTAVLLGCSLQCGAMGAGTDLAASSLYYDFAVSLGMAFQLMDDYLDTFGDPAQTGKKAGGDIAEGKKTWLYIKAREHGDAIQTCYELEEEKERIANATALFRALQLDTALLARAAEFEATAEKDLQQLEKLGHQIQPLRELQQMLSQRSN
ncbi:MAG: polyprenyl synthetase family protein [Bacteroidetes bacterium]|nr:polyprenyl synthetase family protein [Bacteroidota bacterium]